MGTRITYTLGEKTKLADFMSRNYLHQPKLDIVSCEVKDFAERYHIVGKIQAEQTNDAELKLVIGSIQKNPGIAMSVIRRLIIEFNNNVYYTMRRLRKT